MNLQEVMKELQSMGTEQTRKTWRAHQVQEPFFGVKIEDMKKILKRTKINHELSLQLFESGNADAMYLAGLMSDPNKITKQELNNWVKKANCSMISEYAVPWTAAESKFGYELALEWIDSKKETIASSGWCTLSGVVALQPDDQLNLKGLGALLKRIDKGINLAPNRVKYTMNNFVISVGGYVTPLSKDAIATAKKIGLVKVDVGNTACKIPNAVTYIEKMIARGSLGKKRKTVKC